MTKERPRLRCIDGDREALYREIVQDLLHFRPEDARRKCDILQRRGVLRLVGGHGGPGDPGGAGDEAAAAGCES